MRIIARSTLRDFWKKYNDSEQQLKVWFHDVKKSEWKSPSEIKSLYPSVSILTDNRAVFNIKGNHYRLIVKINYEFQIVYIRFVGTHDEYDKIDALKI